MRKTKGVDKQPLTPEKVEKGKGILAAWLKSTGYGKNARQMELNEFDSHAGRCIANKLMNTKSRGHKKPV